EDVGDVTSLGVYYTGTLTCGTLLLQGIFRPQPDPLGVRYLAASGLVALDTDLALTWFETLLAGGASHPVLLAGEYDKVARLLPAASPAAGRLPPRAELQGLDLKQSVVWDLKTMAGDLLKLERGRIDADEMMTRYGFDCLDVDVLGGKF
ncbi:hypothetical protein C3L29_039975, partial [Pseudomonas sp. MWU12-2534b]